MGVLDNIIEEAVQETLQEVLQKAAQGEKGGFPLLGQAVFVRTVTYHYIGYAKEVENGFLKLDSASWIADSGRWADALKNGTLSEVEPYPGACYVSIASIVDVSHWNHSVPREQK